MLMKGGALINSFQFTFNQGVKFQTQLMKTQMQLEDTFTELARNENLPSVIFCDRGLMDGSAYVNEDMWQAVLDEMGSSTMQLRDKRYDAIIHMVTAADGAEEFYNKGNQARYENLKQAVEVDKRLRNAYLGHYKFFILDNKDIDFQGKIDKCVDVVSKIIGMPSPTSFFKKFLIKIPNPIDHFSLKFPGDVKMDSFEVSETLIKPTQEEDDEENERDIEIYLRKRGKHNTFMYNYEIRYTSNNQRIQKQRIITAREYLELIQQRMPHMNTLNKIRSSFEYLNQAYMIETIQNIEGQPTFLRVETSHDNVVIPPFIKVIKDVTSKREFSSPSIAHVDYKYNNIQFAL